MKMAPEMGLVGDYFTDVFGMFDFAGVEQRLPNRTFTDQLRLNVGYRTVEPIRRANASLSG